MILDNIITDNVIGIMMMRSSRLIAGRNTIFGNKQDIRSEESFGKNYDAVSLKYIWDLMNQLY
jgi:parallel beta-helix repeat protein